MKKNALIALIIVCTIATGIVLYERSLGKKVRNQNISERSKEFIQAQKRGSLLADPQKKFWAVTHNKSRLFFFHNAMERGYRTRRRPM
ncbi:MAG: hypothetical protein UZ22_OP11002000870 [Microgenomates bacterium OLB23]|nr:MAG: hypothetical protein UZ22_OP11002000870 [Microgenomates bacterium OLB23]